MIEILDDLDVLLRPYIDLTAIGLGGTALGAPASDVPRGSIVEAQSSLVARYRGEPPSKASTSTPKSAG